MELKEKLELLNEKSSIMEIQKYIKDMKKARKFDGVTIEREMILKFFLKMILLQHYYHYN